MQTITDIVDSVKSLAINSSVLILVTVLVVLVVLFAIGFFGRLLLGKRPLNKKKQTIAVRVPWWFHVSSKERRAAKQQRDIDSQWTEKAQKQKQQL
ncbi:MAG: hypothetical protein RR415_06745 [Ruthenibacterium sp.]